VDEEYRSVVAESKDLGERLDEAARAGAERVAEVEMFDKAEADLTSARSTLETHKSEQAKLLHVRTQQEVLLQQSREAAEKIAQVKAEYERHAAAVLRIKDLERERITREKLREDLARIEAALGSVRSEQKYSREALERASKGKGCDRRLET
jgi:translation initiation factor 1 (eIF-1/SUI1)